MGANNILCIVMGKVDRVNCVVNERVNLRRKRVTIIYLDENDKIRAGIGEKIVVIRILAKDEETNEFVVNDRIEMNLEQARSLFHELRDIVG